VRRKVIVFCIVVLGILGVLTGSASANTGYVTKGDLQAVEWHSDLPPGPDRGWSVTNFNVNCGCSGHKQNQWVNQYGVTMSTWLYDNQTYTDGVTIQFMRTGPTAAWQAWQAWFNNDTGSRTHYGNTGTPVR
jgi:hypothetical protein